MARGVLKNTIARKAAYKADPSTAAYIKELNERILLLVKEESGHANFDLTGEGIPIKYNKTE
jgi:hypothetical protein